MHSTSYNTSTVCRYVFSLFVVVVVDVVTPFKAKNLIEVSKLESDFVIKHFKFLQLRKFVLMLIRGFLWVALFKKLFILKLWKYLNLLC